MKILQVVPTFHPSWGGPFTLVNAISKALVKKGYEVTILTSLSSSSEKIEYTKNAEGVNFHFFRNYFSSQSFNLFFSLELPRFLKNEITNFDVIHLQGYRNLQTLFAQHYAKKFKVHYIIQAHGTLPRALGKSGIKRIFDRIFGYKMLKGATRVIAINKPEAIQYLCMGVPEHRIQIIPNGINFSLYQNLPTRGNFRRKFSIGNNQQIILSLGRIHKIKGLDILVKAFSNIIQETSFNVKLVIAGPDHGYLKQLKSLVESLDISDFVLFVGPVYGREKLEIYVDSDIFVLPSRYEIFGLSLVEASACCKPVIASKVRNLKGLLLEKETGLTFKAGSIPKLSQALIFLLENRMARENYGNAGREYVQKKFNINEMVERLEALYNESSRPSKC